MRLDFESKGNRSESKSIVGIEALRYIAMLTSKTEPKSLLRDTTFGAPIQKKSSS